VFDHKQAIDYKLAYPGYLTKMMKKKKADDNMFHHVTCMVTWNHTFSMERSREFAVFRTITLESSRRYKALPTSFVRSSSQEQERYKFPLHFQFPNRINPVLLFPVSICTSSSLSFYFQVDITVVA
jgi:hypothetical protein